MAQFGKSSGKRGKPTYAYAIIGVSLVLFLFGIVGWFFLNVRKTGDYLKESIQVHAYLSPTASKKQIDSLVTFVNSIPYANRIEYVTKEKALERYTSENDSTWKKIIDANPLPESIDFYVKADFVEQDSLSALESKLMTRFPTTVSEFQTPKGTVASVSQFVKTSTLVLLIVAIILSLLSLKLLCGV